ncbi:hypothetical protein REPUB_Repub03eG0262700 [Reevesia pubescens]
MGAFRKAILQPGPPETFVLKTVQEVIKPQVIGYFLVGELVLFFRPKQTKLAQDENQLLENMLQTLLQELVVEYSLCLLSFPNKHVQSGEEIMQYGKSIDDQDETQGVIPRLLDVVLYLCEKEHVEGGMIFQLLEDLTEMSTMRNCKDIFRYIESKQDILGKQELFARGQLVMLRTCNQLLRRLSKNLENLFHIRCFEGMQHPFSNAFSCCLDLVVLGISVDFNFYKTFWSLQGYFCNPASLSNAPTKWQKFTSSLMVVVNTFEAQHLSEEEGADNNLEEEATTLNIKYLTSSKLMGLEAPGKNDKDSSESMVWWKRDGCPPFEKQPIEKKTVQDGAKRRRPRWRLGNKELSQLWKWSDQNLVYCCKGLRFSARQDLEGFSKFTEHGIEVVLPLELLPAEVRSKFQGKPSDRSKRAKKETKSASHQVEESQIATTASEIDGEGIRGDMEACAAPMDTDITPATGNNSQGGTPTPDEHQKQSPDADVNQEAGQLEADAELETGMIDGETYSEAESDHVG